MTEQSSDPLSAPAGDPSPRRLSPLSAALLGLALVFVVVALWRNWDAVRSDLGQLGWADLLGSAGAGAAATLMSAVAWRLLLGGLGAPMPLRPALSVFSIGQLGKYIPGSVWVVALQAEQGRRHGVGRSVMALSYVVAVLVSIGTGGLVGLLVLVAGGAESLRGLAPALAAVGLLAVLALLRPRAINALIGWTARQLGRPLPDLAIPGRVLAAALACSTGTWLLFGLHAWLLARPVGAGADLLAPTTGAFALAFVAGLLLVPLPAGVGVREGVLVALLAAPLGATAALTVGLVSRFVLVIVDVVLAALFGAASAAGAGRRR